jgi:hypothetical protein
LGREKSPPFFLKSRVKSKGERMSLLICAYGADSVTVCSEDLGGIHDASGTFFPTASGRIKNAHATQDIIFGAIGRNTAADCMKSVVKEFAAFGFERLTEIIPRIARACVDCSGPGAPLAMILAGWDSEKNKIRAVCWNLLHSEQACDTWELAPPERGTGVLIRGPQEVQEAAQRLLQQSTKRVPECFGEVFAQLADMFPEVGRVLTMNTVTRPGGEHLDKQALAYEDTLGNGVGVKISWTAITSYNPDGSTTSIPASTDASQKATVPTPTLSTVAGGSKAARTYFVRMVFLIDGGLRGFSSEVSIAVPANSLLKATSPANTPPWTGWALFISTASGTETFAVSSQLGFGTDWTEPTSALPVNGPQYNSVNSHGVDGFVITAAPYNTSLFFYPYYDTKLGLVRCYGGANSGSGMVVGSASTPENVRGMYLDQNIALAASGLTFTTITASQGASGSTTGGGGFGGCPIDGTIIMPLGCHALAQKTPNSNWIEIELKDGRILTATPDHPVYTDNGKTPLKRLSIGQEVITDQGMVEVVRKEEKVFDAEMLVVSMLEGHLYHANGILSHNIKLPQS